MENNIALIGTVEGSISKNDVRHTGFIVRFLARLLDIIVLVAIINILFYLDTLGGARGWWPPMPFPGGEAVPSSSLLDMVNIIRGLFYAGLHPLYYIIMHAMGGQTLGKMAFRIKVVSITGQDITMGQSIIRWFGYLVCDVTAGVGYLFVIPSRYKQGLHDRIARTTVIYLK